MSRITNSTEKPASKLLNKGILIAILISVIVGSTIATVLTIGVLQPSINSLKEENTHLQSSLTDTTSQLSALDASFTDTQKAYVSASLIDDRLSSTTNHNVKGTVVNFGNETASNIVIVAKWYNLGTSFHQETITIDSLAGRSMMELSFSYLFTSAADDFQYTVTWK